MRGSLIVLGLIGVLGLTGPASSLELAKAPDTVRPCPRHGPGFVQAPGTTTCVRIGGRVTTEYGASARRIDRDRIVGFGTSASVALDARTDTDYGPVRTYLRMRAGQGPGPRY